MTSNKTALINFLSYNLTENERRKMWEKSCRTTSSSPSLEHMLFKCMLKNLCIKCIWTNKYNRDRSSSRYTKITHRKNNKWEWKKNLMKMLFNKCDSFIIIKNKQTWYGNSSTTTTNVQYLKSLKFMQETCHLDYFSGLISVTSIICICLITVVYLWKYKYFWNVSCKNRCVKDPRRTGGNDVENGSSRILK